MVLKLHIYTTLYYTADKHFKSQISLTIYTFKNNSVNNI